MKVANRKCIHFLLKILHIIVHIGIIFYAPVTIVGGIKICPCLSVCLSVRPFVTLYGIEFVLSTPPTVFNGSFRNLAYLLWTYQRCACGFLVELELILTDLQSFELSHFRQLFALKGMEFV